MTRKILILGTIAAVMVLAMGCYPEEDSCNILTDGIYVEYQVMEQNDAASARATFWVGDSPGGTYLTLGSCGDEISVNGVELNKTGSNPEYYEAGVEVADTYDFTFNRPEYGEFVSSITAMPAEVEITSISGDEIARDEEFQITWMDNSDGEIDLLISGDCIEDYPNLMGDDIADTGSHTVGAGAIEVNDNDVGESCAAEVRLTRESSGTLAAELKGTIKGFTRDVDSFTSTPAADETD